MCGYVAARKPSICFAGGGEEMSQVGLLWRSTLQSGMQLSFQEDSTRRREALRLENETKLRRRRMELEKELDAQKLEVLRPSGADADLQHRNDV